MQARSVEFAQKHNVVFEVRSSFNNEPGTIVKSESPSLEDVVISGVAIDRNQTKVTLSGLPDKPGTAAEIFRELGAGMESVIVGAVGVLQFEVLEQRFKNEYNVEVRRQGLPYSIIRWVANPEEVDVPKLNLTHDTYRVENMRGEKLLLFTSEWNLRYGIEHNPNLKLSEFGNVSFK